MSKRSPNTRDKKLKIIGLTGGIASGKTTILTEFKKLGIKTILFKNNRQLIKDLIKLGVEI